MRGRSPPVTTSTYRLHPPLPAGRHPQGTPLCLNPVVVSVPHAGTLVPLDDAPVMAIGGTALLKDADLFVDRLAEGITALGVPVVEAMVSRYVLDVNRAPDDVDRDICPEMPRPARPSARGLCWRVTTDGAAVLRRPLTLAEVHSRRQRIHEPYHAELERLLEQRRALFGFAILIDLHSMPSAGRVMHTDAGQRRADIVPGDVRGTSCASTLSRLVGDRFAAAGYTVRPNDPYMGGYITRHHGRPGRGIHAIQIEVNRDLYMDERTFAFLPNKAAPLRQVIHDVVSSARDLDLR